jgi:hypothetical protein
MPEVVPQLLYVVVPIPLPLSAILILVIDLGFELFAAVRVRFAISKEIRLISLNSSLSLGTNLRAL